MPRLIGLGLFNQTMLAVCLLVPGSIHYWQAWAFMAVTFVLTFFFCAYYYRRDPEFLARRMLRKEKIRAQRLIMFLAIIVTVIFYVSCGLDHRLGWSRTWLGPVPWWLTALALLLYAGSYLLLIPVCNANRFAATIILTRSAKR